MRKTLFTITASLLGLASASAQDVYVYKAGDPNALCGVTNVQRIEFNEKSDKRKFYSIPSYHEDEIFFSRSVFETT